MGGRCGPDSGCGGAQAEERRAGCNPSAKAAERGPLSEDLDAYGGGAGLAATGIASREAGADENEGDEPTACYRHGLCRKKKLWSKAGRQELEALALEPLASRRRKELLELLDQMEKPIAELDGAVEKQAAAHPAAARLMTHPGVGPLTSLAFALTIGEVERFRRSRQVSSYLGLDPS
ncbi:MAG: transposase [Candidatus Acidiferrales bacterium]